MENVVKVLPKYDFIWSQFHNMDTLKVKKQEKAKKLKVMQLTVILDYTNYSTLMLIRLLIYIGVKGRSNEDES